MARRVRWTRASFHDEPTTGVSDSTAPMPSGIGGAVVVVLAGPMTGHLEILPLDGGILGRGQPADIPIDDASISRRHARVVRSGPGFAIEDLGSVNGTFVDDEPVAGVQELPPNCRIRMGRHTILQFTLMDDEGMRAHAALRRSMMLDPLTCVGRRSQMERRLLEEVSFGQRHGTSATVMILDLDHFKAINDRHGHPAGDAVLVAFAELIRIAVRTEDSVFRYGGDEFCVLVRGETPAGLEFMARRICKAVRDTAFEHGGLSLRTTVSIGVGSMTFSGEPSRATCDDRTHADSEHLILVDLADRALLRAKREGRDRVCVLRREDHSDDLTL